MGFFQAIDRFLNPWANKDWYDDEISRYVDNRFEEKEFLNILSDLDKYGRGRAGFSKNTGNIRKVLQKYATNWDNDKLTRFQSFMNSIQERDSGLSDFDYDTIASELEGISVKEIEDSFDDSVEGGI